MQNKKILLVLPVAAMLGMAVLTSCNNQKSDFDVKTHEIYQLYKDNGGTMTYDQWLASIKGEKGDTGATGAAGKDGINGTNGVDGKDGKSVLTGSDTPTASIGKVGDVYINTTNWNVYIKHENGWSESGNIKGAKGDTGATGAAGTNGINGTNGTNGVDGKDGKSVLTGSDTPTASIGKVGDVYINTTNWNVYIKQENGWSESGNIKGAKGDTGATGAAGTNGINGTNGTDGKDGEDGITPHIGENGNWFIGETDTGIKAQGEKGENGTNGTNGVDGKDGVTPHIGANGNWFVGETDTGIKAQGEKGENGINGTNGTDGKDGKSVLTGSDTPTASIGKVGDVYINTTNWNVYIKQENGWSESGNIKGAQGIQGEKGENGTNGINGTNGTDGKDGEDGITPHIGENGNWFVGESDTGIKAQGEKGENGTDGKDGEDGITPHIGENGNWFVGETDTGIKAQGEKGENGINGTNGTDGKDGKSVLTGSDTPTASIGKVGDVYINTTNWNVYIKQENGWSESGNIKGAKGDQGIQGEKGENGTNGTNGKDGATAWTCSFFPFTSDSTTSTSQPKGYVVMKNASTNNLIGSAISGTSVKFEIHYHYSTGIQSVNVDLYVNNVKETVTLTGPDPEEGTHIGDSKSYVMPEGGYVVRVVVHD